MSRRPRPSPPPPRLRLSQQVSASANQRSNNAAVDALLMLFVKGSFLLLLALSSYLAGSLFGQGSFLDSTAMHAPVMSVERLVRRGDAPKAKETAKKTDVDCKEMEEKFIERKVREALEKHAKLNEGEGSSRSDKRRFPRTADKLVNGIARVKKDELDAYFDFGNPNDGGRGTGKEDALILYQSEESLPASDETLAHSAAYNDMGGIPLTDPKTATENCDAMNVIFTANPGNPAQCTAIVGNYESYHIQRLMRVDAPHSSPIKHELPLVQVSRGYASRGKSNFYAPPFEGYVKKHWKGLRTFLENVDSVLEDLEPILERMAKNNAVVVLTCNRGQSALLVNFACSARSRGFDLSNILVFPTDVETKDLAEGLGLTTYHDEKASKMINFATMPSGEARRYGDKNFKAMMYAKVLCVLYPLMLGYDVLFQDVDVVWLKDPFEYFHNPQSKITQFDVIFQHDGSDSVRYAPYSANSGFYYVRANKRSTYLFTSLLYHSDLIMTWDSHQQALIQLLAEHSSLFGLGVKVLGRDTDEFPGGWHYHRNKVFMKKFIKRETNSYIFHMSWTENKDNKLLFLRQLGEWYVEEKCVGKTASEILGGKASSGNTEALVEPCCSVEPIFSCHFSDKPSYLPCKDSDSIDKHGRSFW